MSTLWRWWRERMSRRAEVRRSIGELHQAKLESVEARRRDLAREGVLAEWLRGGPPRRNGEATR